MPSAKGMRQTIQGDRQKCDDEAVEGCAHKNLQGRVWGVAGRVLAAGEIREFEEGQEKGEEDERENENCGDGVSLRMANRWVGVQCVVGCENVHGSWNELWSLFCGGCQCLQAASLGNRPK